MEQRGIFAKEGDPFPGLPYSPWFDLPHHLKTEVDIKAWQEQEKEIKRNCVDFGRCNICLNGTCRLIEV